MKYFFAFFSITAGICLSGCASGGNGIVLGTVGPQSLQSVADNSTNGTLVVYSAYEVGPDFNSRNEFGQSHSDYTISTSDGKPFRKIHNDTGTILQNPAAVQISPGRYLVSAQANGYGYVTIPIVIESQQTTVIHLEGGGAWSNESAFNQTNAVRLPDGGIIGWKAGS